MVSSGRIGDQGLTDERILSDAGSVQSVSFFDVADVAEESGKYYFLSLTADSNCGCGHARS